MKSMNFNNAARSAAAILACSAFALLAGCSANHSDDGSSNGGGGGAGPTVSFKADPTTVAPGGTTTLTWSSNAQDCSGTGGDKKDTDGWNGQTGPNGSYLTTALTSPGPYTYTLMCTATNGSITTDNVNVIVGNGGGGAAGTPPIINLSASPTTVLNGGTTTLTWSTTNASSCLASGGDTADSDGWTGTTGTNGTKTTTALNTNGSYSYTLTCTAANGNSTGVSNVSVTVGKVSAPTVTIDAVPPTVASGATGLIIWSTTNAASCAAVSNSDPAWTGAMPTSGNFTTTAITGPATISYTLTCTGPVSAGSQTGTGTAVQTVATAAAPPPTFSQNFTANPTTVALGGTSVLTWAVTPTTGTVCTGTNGNPADTWNNSTQQPTGTFTTQPFNTAGLYQYTLTCQGSSGSVAQSVTIQAGSIGTPSVSLLIDGVPSVSGVSSEAIDLSKKQSGLLSWTSTNVDSCTASGSWSGAMATSGSAGVGPFSTDGTFSYTLTCTGGGGTAASTAIVTTTGTVPPGPTDCGVGVPSVALINRTPTDTNFTTATYKINDCGLLSNCSVDDPDNVVNADIFNDFGTLNYGLGLLGTGNITFQVIDSGTETSISGEPYDAGQQAGFIIANPNGVLTASVLSPITIETFLRDPVSGLEVPTGDSATTIAQSPNGVAGAKVLTLVGGVRQRAYVSIVTTKKFDAIGITEGAGVASLLNQLDIFNACVADPYPSP